MVHGPAATHHHPPADPRPDARGGSVPRDLNSFASQQPGTRANGSQVSQFAIRKMTSASRATAAIIHPMRSQFMFSPSVRVAYVRASSCMDVYLQNRRGQFFPLTHLTLKKHSVTHLSQALKANGFRRSAIGSGRQSPQPRSTTSPAPICASAIATHPAATNRLQRCSWSYCAGPTEEDFSTRQCAAPSRCGGCDTDPRSTRFAPSNKLGSLRCRFQNTRRDEAASRSLRRADPRGMPAPQAKAEAPAPIQATAA